LIAKQHFRNETRIAERDSQSMANGWVVMPGRITDRNNSGRKGRVDHRSALG
jgi:hypothetical protein